MLTGTLITGLGLGSMYGLVALGFHVTYAVSSTVNFAQGSAVTLGAVLGYTLAVTLGWPMPAAKAAEEEATRAVNAPSARHERLIVSAVRISLIEAPLSASRANPDDGGRDV